MKGSKLENYLAVMHILSATHHPLKFSEIVNATRLEQLELEEALSFLIERHVIRKQKYGSSYAFSIEPSGNQLIRYFSSHTQLDRQI